jgi:flagellin-like protein
MGRKTSLKNTRAIAPIFAALILIAIAVVGGVVVYMYTSGYLGGMTGGGGVGQEKVAIEAIVVNDAAQGNVTLYCKSLAGGDVIVADAVLKDSAGSTLEVLTLTTDEGDRTLPAAGTMTGIECDFQSGLTVGNAYTVTLISKAGNQFLSNSFKA